MEGPQDGQGPQGTPAPREPPVAGSSSSLSGPQDSQCLGDPQSPQCSQDSKCRRDPQSPEVLPPPWCPQSPKAPLHTCGLHRVWEPQGAQHWHCPGDHTQLQNPRSFQGLKPAWGIPVTLVVLTPLGSLVPARAAAAAHPPAPPRRLQRPPRTFYSKQLLRLRQSFRENRQCVPYRECRKLVAQLHLGMVYQPPDETLPERRLTGQQTTDTPAPHPIVQEDSSEAQGCDPDPASSPQLPSTPESIYGFLTSNVTSSEGEVQ